MNTERKVISDPYTTFEGHKFVVSYLGEQFFVALKEKNCIEVAARLTPDATVPQVVYFNTVTNALSRVDNDIESVFSSVLSSAFSELMSQRATLNFMEYVRNIQKDDLL